MWAACFPPGEPSPPTPARVLGPEQVGRVGSLSGKWGDGQRGRSIVKQNASVRSFLSEPTTCTPMSNLTSP